MEIPLSAGRTPSADCSHPSLGKQTERRLLVALSRTFSESRASHSYRAVNVELAWDNGRQCTAAYAGVGCILVTRRRRDIFTLARAAVDHHLQRHEDPDVQRDPEAVHSTGRTPFRREERLGRSIRGFPGLCSFYVQLILFS